MDILALAPHVPDDQLAWSDGAYRHVRLATLATIQRLFEAGFVERTNSG